MSKQSVVEGVAASLEIPKEKANGVVNAVVAAIASTVSSGSDVRLTGFGTFRMKHSPQRDGRNPATGDRITIPARSKVVFKASKIG